MQVPLKIDLLELLKQAAPQVYGSDERDFLSAFIERCGPDDDPVIVTIDFSKVIIKGPGG